MSTATRVAGPETDDELQRLKTEFLTSLNQEIRTPLSSILGITELRNAVEFTRQGEVELVAGGSPDGQDRFLLRVEVRDTGAGMAPEQLGLIFQPFRQLEGGLARSHPGLGLGLALVDKLVRLMGGQITARSEPGQGSALEFRVPLRIPAAVRDHHPP